MPHSDAKDPVIWIAFTWLSRFSGTLSFIGSSLIIFIIIRGGKEKLSRIHNRLLLCMSSVDLLNSVNLGTGVNLNPRYLHPYIYGASGTDATCSIQGFLLTVGFSVPMYNAVLCLYYMAVIRYNMKEDVLKKIEPYAHAVALALPLATAIYGVSADLFHSTYTGYCFGGDGCLTLEDAENNDCVPRPKILFLALDFIFYALAGLVFIIIVSTMTLTYLAVRHQASKMKKYQSLRRSSFTLPSNTTTTNNPCNDNQPRRRASFTLGSPPQSDQVTRTSMQRPQRNEDSGKDEETFAQALLYVSAYVLTYGFPIACTVIAGYPLPSPLLLSMAFFFPLQGLWNFCIYVRPKCILVKKTMKDASLYTSLKIVICTKNLDEFLQQERARNRSDINRVTPSRRRILEMAKMHTPSSNCMNNVSNNNNNNDDDDDGEGKAEEVTEEDIVFKHEESKSPGSSPYHAQHIWSTDKDTDTPENNESKDMCMNTNPPPPQDEESIDEPMNVYDKSTKKSTILFSSPTPNKVWTAEDSSERGEEGGEMP